MAYSDIASTITSINGDNQKGTKGDEPPGIGGDGGNENENEKEKWIGQKQREKASNVVAAAHGSFI